MKKVLIGLIFLSMIMAMTNISSMGAQINVPADYSSIQQAIEEAGDGDVIIVQPGTYKESIDFLAKAITLKGTDPNNPDIVAATVLDGRGQRVVIFQNEEGNDTVLSGFTIMNGYSHAHVEPDGAGILCGQNSSPTISHCIIRENTAMGTSEYCGGGGIACADESSPIISHCTIIDNSTLADGGGIYCGFDSSPIISYCTISGNEAARQGGGIYCMKGAFPTITHCTISVNSSTNNYGGGICFAGTGGSPIITPSDLPTSVISHCTITENTSDSGGGIYCSHILDVSIIISNCRINKNSASSGGGGISIVMTYSPITITNCVIEENSQANPFTKGGGIYCYYNHSLTTINECIILKNTSAGSGGGIDFTEAMFSLTKCIIKENVSQGTNLGHGGGGIWITSNAKPLQHGYISNCIITKNFGREGGGIYFNFVKSLSLSNCTITANTATNRGGGFYLIQSSELFITNSIIFYNTPDEIIEVGSYALIEFSNILGGFRGDGNIDAPPLFYDKDGGDYHLRPDSPCIDTGTSQGAPDTDIEGYKRPYGSKYDMGAYEYSQCDPSNVTPELCDNMDNDCDGLIDEDFNAGAICTVGIGLCKKEGIIVCKEDGSGAECNVTPGDPLPEVCNGKDDDCDGEIDDNLRRPCTTSEGQGTQTCQEGQWGPCITPKPEVCDGIDNDLDGQIDEGVKITFFRDEDNDGYGNPGETTEACEPPSGYVADNSDCNDSDPERYPGNTEVCDGKDNDCDGYIDEEGSQDCIIYYKDEDQDGYGLETDNRCLCQPDITNKYNTTLPGDPDDKDHQIPVADITTHLDLPAGWSMISLPVRPLTMALSELFPQAVVVYSYKKGSGYVRVKKAENLEVGKGYWILFNEAQRCSLTGKPIQGYIKTVYDNGWYMIGGCSYPAKASTEKCNIGVIYSYVQGTGYKRILSGEDIASGKGYWILLNNIMDQADLVITGTEPTPEIELISLSVNPKDVSFTSIGQTHQLTVTGQYSDGNSADLTNSSTGTTYTSSDTSVATVDNDGLVSAAGSGTIIITVTNGSLSDTVTVNVSEDVPNLIADAGLSRFGIVPKDMNGPHSEEIVYIDASASIGNEWNWEVIAQSVPGQYTLTSPNTRTTGFYAKNPGEYTLQLTVGNGQGKTATDTCIITLIEDMDADGLTDIEDYDRDGDGFLNPNDLFPDDRVSHYDYDSNGIGNYYTHDVDDDGVDDIYDDLPLDPGKSEYEIHTEVKETSASNQNDSIASSEEAGIVPKRIKGYLSAVNNGEDMDYYQLSFDNSGNYSLMLTGSAPAMNPTLSIIADTNTQPLPTEKLAIPQMQGSTYISVSIPNSGTYYLKVTDSSGNSDSAWEYTIEVFSDEDMDGLPDDLEKALDMNHLSKDGDEDGIIDYLEVIQALKKDWAACDIDGDQVPNWWDLDSDGDMVPDSIEYFTEQRSLDLPALYIAHSNDIDRDGTYNFHDSDSDENGIEDIIEAGINPQRPLDTDSDYAPDYIDSDDDNDGLLDVNEEDEYRLIPLTPTETPEANSQPGGAMRLTGLNNIALGIENVCRAGDTVYLTGNNLPSSVSDTWIIIRSANNLENLHPIGIDNDGLNFVWPSSIESGMAYIFLAYDNQHTSSINVFIPSENAPLLTKYTMNLSLKRVTFTGMNLDQSLTVKFSGASIITDNSSGSSTTVTVDVPLDAQGGYVYVSCDSGDSNTLWINLRRSLSGKVILPDGSDIDVTKLDLSWPGDPNEMNPDPNGNFITSANMSRSTTITAFLECIESTEDNPVYAVLLQAVALKDDNLVILNSRNTAIASVWGPIDVEALVSESSLPAARDILSNLQVIKEYGLLINSKLLVDPCIFNKADPDIINKETEAISVAQEAIQNALANGQLIANKERERIHYRDLVIEPEIVDDIKLADIGDYIELSNDTQLFLSVQITNSKRTLYYHINSYGSMVGPQGWMFISNKKTYNINNESCTVEVITAGFAKDDYPYIDARPDVWNLLFFRTVAEKIVYPLLTELDLDSIPPSDLAKILKGYAPNIVDIFTNPSYSYTDICFQVWDILWKDFCQLSPEPGPISTAIYKAILRKSGQEIKEDMLEFMIKDMAKKLAIKVAKKFGLAAVPGVGWVSTGYHIVKYGYKAAQIGTAIGDFINTDQVIEFEVEGGLSIENVTPDKVLLNGKNTIFTITGGGFSEVKRQDKQILRPLIMFRDMEPLSAQDHIVYCEPDYISGDGKEMKVVVPGNWLDPNHRKGPAKVRVHHPIDKPEAIAEKYPAVEFFTKPVITQIDPPSCKPGDTLSILGYGFSKHKNNNQVEFSQGDTYINRVIEILSENDSLIRVIVPEDLDEGISEIRVRSIYDDGAWSDWSNSKEVEIECIPAVFSINASSAAVAPGESIEVSLDLEPQDANISVTWGKTGGIILEGDSDREITWTAPEDAEHGDSFYIIANVKDECTDITTIDNALITIREEVCVCEDIPDVFEGIFGVDVIIKNITIGPEYSDWGKDTLAIDSIHFTPVNGWCAGQLLPNVYKLDHRLSYTVSGPRKDVTLEFELKYPCCTSGVIAPCTQTLIFSHPVSSVHPLFTFLENYQLGACIGAE